MRNQREEWKVIVYDFANGKVEFDVIEEFVEELLDDVDDEVKNG